jgi:transcriptional regulator
VSIYNPPHFRVAQPELLHRMIARYPLATLITSGGNEMAVSYLPLLYFPREAGAGVLQGHMARANSQWQSYSAGSPALALFNGPQHYITPNWYMSKAEHGKVVPTWNYVAVHAHGTLTFKDDPEWILANVQALTNSQEQASANPWRVSDAPPEFIQQQLRAIVGVELSIAKLEGKWKVSQNRSREDREGVIAGLHSLESSAAEEIADLVAETL